MKVLVVEDDPDQLELRCLLLQRAGFVPFAASDSDSAVLAARAEKPQCALVDLRLPREEDGLQLIETLKRLDPAMHVVVLTGSDPRRYAIDHRSSLIDQVFVKGGRTAELLRHLTAVAAR